jgi:hypothetical protein
MYTVFIFKMFFRPTTINRLPPTPGPGPEMVRLITHAQKPVDALFLVSGAWTNDYFK